MIISYFLQNFIGFLIILIFKMLFSLYKFNIKRTLLIQKIDNGYLSLLWNRLLSLDIIITFRSISSHSQNLFIFLLHCSWKWRPSFKISLGSSQLFILVDIKYISVVFLYTLNGTYSIIFCVELYFYSHVIIFANSILNLSLCLIIFNQLTIYLWYIIIFKPKIVFSI